MTIGAFAIIQNEKGNILIVHRNDYDCWNMPGGRLDEGEQPHETVVREVKEEVGIDVEVEKLVGVYVKTDQEDTVFVYVCKKVGGNESCTAECRQWRYVSLENVPDHMSPAHLERIIDFLSHQDKDYPVVNIKRKGYNSRELVENGEIVEVVNRLKNKTSHQNTFFEGVQAGLDDVKHGRVHTLDEIKEMFGSD